MKQKRKKSAQLPFRLNLLFFIIFVLFTALIIQLGTVQILNGQKYQDEVYSTVKDTIKIPVPRGNIYDRNHKVVVDNKALYAITYIPPKGVQAEEKLKVAQDLSKFMTMYDKKTKKSKLKTITDREKREYWYLRHPKKANKKISKKEISKLDNTEQYNTILDRITKDEISHFSEEDLQIILIKKEMDKAYELTPKIIKNENVSFEEYAKVSEHLDELPGINTTTDWNRSYPFKDTFKNILGTVTSEKQGIPSEKLSTYLAKGYNRNDRVGKSGLEEQYEDFLQGKKEQVQYTTNKQGEIVDTSKISDGESGNDLVLTIDMDLQKRVSDLTRDQLKTTKNKNPYLNRYLQDVMAVALNPKTGEILAISGQHYNKEKGKYENADHQVMYDARQPGSVVKGATILSGFQSEVINIGTTFYDEPIKIAGTPPKKSWKPYGLGTLNDIDALKVSSNIYMFHIAMRMGGEYNYQPGKKIVYHPEAITEMRNYFSQFGLGVETRVDFPYEATGYKGEHPKAGNLLDFAIGNYDTFTTLQLAQYVSTIANDGYRIRPHFLKEVRAPIAEDYLGPIRKEINPDILNKIQMDDQYIKRVQEGFRRVAQSTDGTAHSYFNEAPYNSYNIAAKTGTAENEIYEDGKKVANTENHSLVAYAPFDNPEIAIAVLVPNTGIGLGTPTKHNIAKGIFKAYYDLKKERESENN